MTAPASTTATVIVCHGDETGQELLEESLRVLDSDLVRPIVDYRCFAG